MKILALDIETAPAVVYTWGLFDQRIGLNQVVDTGGIMCFAAKFIGEPARAMRFFSTHKHGREEMLSQAHALLDEADVVLHYNGRKFDIPHLNRGFVEAGMTPPSPFRDIDLYATTRRRFKFLSNRLDHVSTQLGLEGKIAHEGFDLWRRCLAGDDLAWKRMERYNRRDVVLLEELYEILRPWVPNHPNAALVDDHDGHACPRCSSTRVQRRGLAHTNAAVYQRYQCMDCGGWSRSTKRVRGVGQQDIVSAA